MIHYILEVSLCWLIFYLLYYFWLSKETFFQLNRWYLLSTLFLGLIIPLIPSPFSSGGQESEWVTLYVAPFSISLDALQITVSASAETEQPFDWLALLKWIYWVGLAFCGFRFLSGLWRIGLLYWRAEHKRAGNFSIALTHEPHLPFSFFRVVFKSKLGALDPFAEEKITDHELAHVRGWHTIDVLLVELVSIFLWCSPTVYLYRRSLRIVHEYIADSAAIQSGQKKQYGHLLIRQSQSGLQLALANHFIQSQLKKRIMMMTKTRSRRQAFLKYLPVIPLLVVALVVFSNWKAAANDPLIALESNALEKIEVMAPLVAEDFDPRVLRKKLSAILHQRSKVPVEKDAGLAKNFVATCDEWAEKYPEHQAEIRKIAAEVADQYDLAVNFSNGKIKAVNFKNEMKVRHTEKVKPGGDDQGIINMDNNQIGLKVPGAEDPYVLINDKAAPSDWKAKLSKDNIDRIDVLKGETAKDKFGEKGRNGVILIYTKDSGKNDRTLPRFPGCEDMENSDDRDKCAQSNLLEYVHKNIKYPENARKYNVQGLVVASYVVGKTGTVKDIRIIKSIGGDFDREVIRVLSSMPQHVPGTLNGEPIEVEMKLPIKFKATQGEVEERAGLPNPKVIISKLSNGEGSPLHILDGKIVDQEEVWSLNPDDIEKIEVLKDKEALARYGSKAADGVVSIFTKGRRFDRGPIFQGCEEAEKNAQTECSQGRFLKSVYQNITYPAAAREQGIQGTVIVKYVIGEDGKIRDTEILKGIGGGCDEEALRVISEMPDWQPAVKDGRAVAVEMVLPIQFLLEGGTGEDKDKDARKAEMAYSEQLLKKVEQKYQPAVGKAGDKVVVTGYDQATPGQEVFKVVEEMPRFPGCENEVTKEAKKFCADKKLLEFIYENIKYPAIARKNGVEGMVIVQFVVEKDGTVTDAKVGRDIGAQCGQEALRVVNLMNNEGIRWTPGKQRGRPVRVQFNLPVRFKLDEGNKPKAANQPPTIPAAGKLELRQFKAAPNPTTGQINLRFQSEAVPVSIRILTANGQTVYQRELPEFSGNFDEKIDLKDVPKGTLFIRVQQGEKIHSSTLILQ